MSSQKGKTLGQAIDEVISALGPLDKPVQVTAIRAACEHLGLQMQLPVVSQSKEGSSAAENDADVTPATQPAGSSQATDSPTTAADISSFREEKKPKTAVEMACLVAYYLESLAPVEERKKKIGKADLEKYFKQARHMLPKRIEQVLVDAKAAGYFDSAGRGQYELNPVGYNLVVHTLPRSRE